MTPGDRHIYVARTSGPAKGRQFTAGAQVHRVRPWLAANVPKTGVTWNEIELRIAVLQILLAARKQRPTNGGASMRMLLDVLHLEGTEGLITIEFALWYLREKGCLDQGERVFMITAKGLDYLTDQLSQTQILDGGGATEKKINKIVTSGLPARIEK